MDNEQTPQNINNLIQLFEKIGEYQDRQLTHVNRMGGITAKLKEHNVKWVGLLIATRDRIPPEFFEVAAGLFGEMKDLYEQMAEANIDQADDIDYFVDAMKDFRQELGR
jgi:hypothetical protein